MSSQRLERPVAGTAVRRLTVPSAVLTEYRYQPGVELQPHVHNHAFLTFVLDGTYHEAVNRVPHECHPREVRFLPAGELHTDRFFTDTRCLHIEIGDALLAGFRHTPRLAPGRMHAPAAPGLATRLYRELVSNDELSGMAVEALLTELLIESSRANQTSGRPPRWLSRVEELLRDRFAEKLALPEIAQAANVHVVHLCREFHRHRQCTVGEFIRRLRVERAARLLAESDKTIADIAVLVGCSDQSHLCLLFKQQMGMTPGTYRALFRRE